MKNTRKSLFMSAISLFLCMTMLLGSTFAWFTDIASSKNNKIQAGKLDVQLRLWTGSGTNDFEEITDASAPLFGVGNPETLAATADSKNTVWEPGKTQTV